MKNRLTVITIGDEYFNVEAASQLCGIHPDIISDFEKANFVSRAASDSNGSPLFDGAGICRLRLLRDLREREHLSIRMIKIVCQLLNRLEKAEDEVRFLRNIHL